MSRSSFPEICDAGEWRSKAVIEYLFMQRIIYAAVNDALGGASSSSHYMCKRAMSRPSRGAGSANLRD